jgi:hypothetical protein
MGKGGVLFVREEGLGWLKHSSWCSKYAGKGLYTKEGRGWVGL